MTRLPFALALVLSQAIAVGQSTSAQRDSLRELVSAMKLALAQVDSSGPLEKAVESRIQLAALVKDKEAIPLLDAAAALSDSLNDARLEGTVRVALSKRLSAMGNYKRANAELLLALELGEAVTAANNERQAKEAADQLARHLIERDSLIAAREGALSLARRQAGLAQKEIATREWMLVATAALAVAIIFALVILLRRAQRKAIGKLRAEVEGFRARIGEMTVTMEALKRKLDRPAVVAPSLPTAPTPAQPTIAGPDAATHDPMVLALFLKQAPERLATFKDARLRGDIEKAVRVVHTLKPSLVSLDAARFTVLCARLVAPGYTGSTAWNSDADTFTAAIEALLGQR
ncbi:MAG TPA: Hpt domain-containing protein [Flavobacteriales bacterium]|nr:Hpt domain-containing protein [Flavobacteriales bacterium]